MNLDVPEDFLNPAQMRLRVTTRSRGVHHRVAQKLKAIADEGAVDESTHGKLRALVTFDLEAGEKRRAARLKANLTKIYGTDSSFCGFRFVILRNMEGTEEYLAVVYEPRRIVPGKFAARQRERQARDHARYVRRRRGAAAG